MKENNSFEKSFQRLEEILKLLNEGKVNLEESLTLFEEANSLINKCNGKLQNAEQKIETLIKTRDNSLEIDNENLPKKQIFSPPSQDILK